MAIKKYFSLVLINFLVLAIGLLIIELCFGGWLSDQNRLDNLYLLIDKEFSYSTDLYTNSEIEIKYSRDKYGLRGQSTFNTPEKIDILTLGGSTTDQRYITDGKTWQDVLQQSFISNGKEVLISNAGVDGQSTYGHIENFKVWFPIIPKLKPKYIIFYIGINDYYKSKQSKFDVLTETNTLKGQIITNSALYNLYRTLHGIFIVKKHEVGHSKIDFSIQEYISNLSIKKNVADIPQENLDEFEKRIRILLDQTKALGAKAIFITQPSLYFKWDDNHQLFGLNPKNSSISGFEFFNYISKINDRIRKVSGDDCIIVELTTLSIWDESDFYDFSHNTPEGAIKVGEQIYEQLKDKID